MKNLLILLLIGFINIAEAQKKIKYGNFSPQLKADLKDIIESIISDSIRTDYNDKSVTDVVNGYKIVNVKDYGAVSDGSTDDVVAIDSAIANLADSGATLIMEGDFVVGKAAAIQLNFSGKRSLTVDLKGSIKLDDDTQTDALGAPTIFYFDETNDGLRFDGYGSSIDMNRSSQSGWSGGWGAGEDNGAISIVGILGDSVENVKIKNVNVINSWRGSISSKYVKNMTYSNCSFDSVGEGYLMIYPNGFDYNKLTIGKTMAQDGLEVSNGKNGFIRNCINTDSSGDGTRIDIFKCQNVHMYSNILYGASIDFAYDSTWYIYIYENDFFDMTKGFFIRTLDVGNAGDCHFINIFENNFHMKISSWILDVYGDVDYDLASNFYNNTIYFNGASKTQWGVRYYGYCRGMRTFNNTLIVQDTSSEVTAFVYDDRGGIMPKFGAFVDNDCYNVDKGFYIFENPIDSVIMQDNNFFYTDLKTSLYFKSAGEATFGPNSYIGNNGGDPYIRTNAHMGTGGDALTFYPLGGISHYDTWADIDSIAPNGKAPDELVFICAFTIVGDSIYDSTRLRLDNDVNFAIKQNNVLVLKRLMFSDVEVWFEASRIEN